MKKLNLYASILGIVLPLYLIAKDASYTIHGKIGKLNSPAKAPESRVYLDHAFNEIDDLAKDQRGVFLKFMKNNPNSLMSLFVLKCYGEFDCSMLLNNSTVTSRLQELDSRYISLSMKARSSKTGIEFRDKIAGLKKIRIGLPAPDFTQPDTSGKLVLLHDFKGKYVLIDFWVSWCGCHAENPTVVKAFHKYRDNGFTVLDVSLDPKGIKQECLQAIHEEQMTWTQVSNLKGAENAATKLYNVLTIPQNFFVAPPGKIAGIEPRGEELKEILKKLNLNDHD